MAKVFIGNIKGPKGEAGQQGTSISHSWDGTTLTVVSASGVSSVDLKGEKGENGTTPIVGVDYFTELDKKAIIDSVLSSLPVYNGEVTEV